MTALLMKKLHDSGKNKKAKNQKPNIENDYGDSTSSHSELREESRWMWKGGVQGSPMMKGKNRSW
jgi:hypothetical protein